MTKKSNSENVNEKPEDAHEREEWRLDYLWAKAIMWATIRVWPMNEGTEKQRKALLDKALIAIEEPSPDGDLIDLFLHETKWVAELMGVEFKLDWMDVVFPMHCPIMHLPLLQNIDAGYLMIVADRIDKSKGFVPGNILYLSREAETAKMSMFMGQGTVFNPLAMAALHPYFAFEGLESFLTDRLLAGRLFNAEEGDE